MSVLLYATSAWAQISVTPSTGVYWKNGAVSSDRWAPIWKSNVTAADGSTPLLVMTAGTGIDTSNGDIYASTYTLEAPAGYVISSYTLNGTATGGDVTITPSGESATVISNGNSLVDALAVTVRAQSTSFVLAGGHLANVALNVTVSPTPVIVAMNSANKLPSAYGGFSGQTFTTAAASGLAGVTITATSGLTIKEATVNVAQYGKCFSLATAAPATDYTVTMTAPEGYVITGYYLGCSANTKDAVHTLTSADGSVSVVASAPPYNNPANAPKVFEVTGLNTNSTYFTINTANKANTLYLPTFYITVAKASEVGVTYNVMYNGSQVASANGAQILGKDAPSLPSSLVKDYCTYTYYSDAACTEEITKLKSATVYVKCATPFEASTAFNSATWYYLKLKDANYPTYVADGTPNVTLPASNAGDRTTQWAFFGNPYDGFTLKNRAAGNDLVLGSAAAGSNDNNGGNTYATLSTPGSQAYELWFPASSTHFTNGLFLNNGQDYALNQRSTNNLAYWTGGKDAGSTFVVEAAPSDAEYLTTLLSTYTIAAASLDKPGFPTTAAYNTFRSAIEAYASIEDAEANLATDLATLRSATIYPNGTYYIKNRNTGSYAFITDDGEVVPRLKVNAATPHENNNYLWTVTSDKNAGTCTIVSSLYPSVAFAKGNNNTYANNTASNVTAITTLSTELFSSNNGTSGGFYLDGAHHQNNYKAKTDEESFVCSWNYQDSSGSQWIFEPVTLGTEYTVTVEGLNDGGEDAVTLSDGTIVNLGTGTVYLSETPTTSNITQNEVTGYSIQDGSIVVDNENHTITVTYSPSYDVLIANYWRDNNIAAKIANAGQYGYPATDNEYNLALNGVQAAITGGSYTGNATNYNNLKTWYAGFLAADVVVPTAGFYRLKSSPTWTNANLYLMGVNSTSKTTRAALYASNNANYTVKGSTWYFDGMYMYNFSNGLPAVKDGDNMLGVATGVGAAATTIAFQKPATAELGSLNVKFATNRYLYANNGFTDAGGSAPGLGYNWVVEDVTSLPVTISAAGYATLYAPVALTIPEDVTAYVATVDNGSYLHLEEISGGVIPANTGVILKGEADTYNFGITTGGSAEDNNVLTGTVAAIARPSGSYILSNGTYGVGFYGDGASTIPGFKSYLPAEAAQGIRGFLGFNFDDPTAISVIEAAMNAGKAIYDLSGRRVENPVSGLYIVNGKKVFINKK